MSVLWLTDKTGYKGGTRAVITSVFKKHGVATAGIFFNSLHYKVEGFDDYPKRKIPTPGNIAKARQVLNAEIAALKPKVIVIADQATLRMITGKPYTIATTRGSVYQYNGIPCVVIKDYQSIHKEHDGKFVYQFDLGKIIRYAKGTIQVDPAFDYRLVKSAKDLLSYVEEAKAASMVSLDIETSTGHITCISYTYDIAGGKLRTIEIPFFDPFVTGGTYWASEQEEIQVRRILAGFNASPVTKVMQNGGYDCAYLIAEQMPVVNYFIDTQNMMHSIWCEARKSLDKMASYFCDGYVYWKDESKGIKEDGWGKNRSAVEQYWRYNGLDSYWTWLVARELLSRITKLEWAVRNYNTEFSLSVGPCLAASLRGSLWDLDRHEQIMQEQRKKAAAGRTDIQRFTNVDDFNTRSPNDVAWFLYDVLGAQKTRLQRKGSKYGPRSTDEKVLKLIKEQGNVFVNNFIDRLLRAKKPAGVLSKYGNLHEMLGPRKRFQSWANPAGTDTGRFSSTNCQFWTGTNEQNIPPELREIFIADSDYVFCDIDYSASDDHFIAYECEDEHKIEMVESDTDTHCYHASIFFSKPYDVIYKGYKANEPWVVDSTTGIRQNTKRVTHGKNFMMGPGTMYNVMGRDAVIATALALGHERALRYNDKELIGICQDLCDKYDHKTRGLYKRIRVWHEEIIKDLRTRGGLATCAFGMTKKFLGDPDDHETQRALASFYGQGGTAGNINRALIEIFYTGIDDGKTCIYQFQGHDSLRFLVHKDHLYKCGQIQKVMEKTTVIHGREMGVPAVPEVGLTWSKKMLKWTPETTYADIVAFEDKTFAKKYVPQVRFSADNLEALLTMELDNIDLRRPYEHANAETRVKMANPLHSAARASTELTI